MATEYLKELRQIRNEEVAKQEKEGLFVDLDNKIKEAAKTTNVVTHRVSDTAVNLFVWWAEEKGLKVTYTSTDKVDEKSLMVRW